MRSMLIMISIIKCPHWKKSPKTEKSWSGLPRSFNSIIHEIWGLQGDYHAQLESCWFVHSSLLHFLGNFYVYLITLLHLLTHTTCTLHRRMSCNLINGMTLDDPTGPSVVLNSYRNHYCSWHLATITDRKKRRESRLFFVVIQKQKGTAYGEERRLSCSSSSTGLD